MRAGLDEELVAPAVECLEGFRAVHVVYKDAAVGATVESNAERLEPFLASGVPQLFDMPISCQSATHSGKGDNRGKVAVRKTYLHGY